MDFFKPPEVSEPGFSALPEPSGGWEPPRNQIGGPVPIRLSLARTDEVAVAILGGAAYPTGFEFVVSIRFRDDVGTWQVCESRARGLAITRAEVDAALVLGAAERSETLWPQQPYRGGVRSRTMNARQSDEPRSGGG